jgi:hypothetical protein
MIEYTMKVKIFDNGTRETYNDKCQLHSFNDEPALIAADGTRHWFKDHKRHRDNDLPAIVYADGTNVWYKDGKRHRDNDEPAFIYINGSKFWYKDDKLHRDNDEPAIVYPDGTKFWYKDGFHHTPAPKVTTCNGKIVEIDGKKYKLTEV